MRYIVRDFEKYPPFAIVFLRVCMNMYVQTAVLQINSSKNRDSERNKDIKVFSPHSTFLHKLCLSWLFCTNRGILIYIYKNKV